MNFLSQIYKKITGFFLYTQHPNQPGAESDEVYDKELLINVDHEVINVGSKLKDLIQSSNDLDVKITELATHIETIKYLESGQTHLEGYNKVQDMEIEKIKAAEFDSSNGLKNIIERFESLQADVTKLKNEVNELKVLSSPTA